MTERKQTSRRVVDRKVIGSANPVAKWGRDSKRTCFDSIGGFFVGLLLFCIPFGLTYCAGTKEKDSKDIARLDAVQTADIAGFTGKALVEVPELTALDALAPPIGDQDPDLIAYKYTLEKWETWTETHTETETKIENGQEVEYTYEVEEEVSGWKEKEREEKWSALSAGDIRINHGSCEIQLDWEQSFFDEYTDAATDEKFRETVEVVLSKPDMLLAAEFDNGQIAKDPDFSILTTKDKEQLVESLNLREETTRWMLLVFAVILMFISMNLMLGPAMLIINIIPIKQLSCAVRFVIGILSLFLSITIVAVTYLFVRYWWVVVLLLLGLAIWLIVDANKDRQAEPDLGPDIEPDEPLTEQDQS